MLERVFANSERTGGLWCCQYSFRKARSTIDPVRVVVYIVRIAIEVTRWRRGSKTYCVILSLGVRNTFNSANWNRILEVRRLMEITQSIRYMIVS